MKSFYDIGIFFIKYIHYYIIFGNRRTCVVSQTNRKFMVNI